MASQLLPQEITTDLVEEAIAWSSMNGLQMVHPHHNELHTFIHAPFSLLPNVVPRSEFETAKQLAPLLSTLVDRVACDRQWLVDTLKPVLGSDDFTRRLVELMLETPHQTKRLGLHRSDYMLHEPTNKFLQVELNTIASSFGSISSRVADLHSYILSKDFVEVSQALMSLQAGSKELPPNPALQHLPGALAQAHSIYGADEGSVICFVVQEGERNVIDQKLLELALWNDHHIRVKRATLKQINDEATVDAKGCLKLGGGEEVSVFYFRAGYTPNDYPSEKEWDARRKIETSTAIKCPCLSYHLVGTKKVQQQLANPGEVERFMSAEDSTKIRQCFADLFPVSVEEMDEAAHAAVKDAVMHPERYVLKPQREGGGNNFYGQDLARKLQQAFPSNGEATGLPDLILMQRIMPPQQPAVLVVNGQSSSGQTLSEFGIFGTFLCNEDDAGTHVSLNQYSGHILRTKLDGVDEGGVATGYSVLSSPVLSDS